MVKVQSRESIKNKLTLLLMLVSVVLLVIVSLVVLTAEVFATRAALVQDLRVLTAAVGNSSRQSLVLGQYQTTEKFLAALATQKHIHAAYLFNGQGDPVAEYLAQKNSVFAWKFLAADFTPDNSAYWTTSTKEQINWCSSHLGIFTPIFYEGNRVGTLYVLSDLDALYGRLSGVAFGTTLALMLLFVFSWILAGRLQKPISAPLLNLAGVMEKISVHQDYSVRATKMSNDEIALLVDGLNHMLDQVEDHQRQQARYQEHLELTVDQRTAALRAAVIELKQARRQADAANEAKSHFLSRMTHELRTPLIGVLGMNGLLQRTPLSEHQRTLVETVDKSGHDLLALISDVLDIARIEAGVLELDVDEIEPARIIEEVVQLLAPQAQARGVELLTDIPLAALCPARGDRARIWQILMNLIGNAIKFTPAGSVTARLQLIPENQGKGRFIIAVEDTGIGMDATTSQRIFDLFYQHNGVSSDVSSGSGLGLPIVKQLVNLMSGSISVVSRPAAGSCFTVELSLPLLEQNQPAARPDLSGAQVVVAVARSASATVLERQLTELGADVIHPHSAPECLQMLMALQRRGIACPLLLLSHDWYLQLSGRDVDVPLTELTRQLVLVCRDSAVNIPVIDHVLLLYQPFTWRGLLGLLDRVPGQEQLLPCAVSAPAVPLLPPVADIDAQNSCRAPRVIYVGRHAAERQLLRLTLAAWRIVPDCVDNIHDAMALCRHADVLLMILDADELTTQSFDELLTLKADLPPCYLLGEHEPAALVAEPVIGCLEKPVSKPALHQILEPLLTKAAADSTVAVREAI